METLFVAAARAARRCLLVALLALVSMPALAGSVRPPSKPALLQTFALDLLVAAASRAPGIDHATLSRLGRNGMRVVSLPLPLTLSEAKRFWRAVDRIDANLRARALALFLRSDVVTTEAHALLLSMVGPPPAFAPAAPIAGLEPRQDKFARERIELSSLLQSAWQEAAGTELWRDLTPMMERVQPTAQELAGYEAALARTFVGEQAPRQGPSVLVEPLMAKDTGATLMQSGAAPTLLLGPSANAPERDTLALHEMLHPHIAQLIALHPELRAAIAESRCLRQAYDRLDGAAELSQVYDSWPDYLAETWVRGLSHRLGHTPQEPRGFPLAASLAQLSDTSADADALAAAATRLLLADRARLCHS